MTSIALLLITVPLYLTLVGAERYGVLSLTWLFLGYFGLFDFGLGRATTQRMAQLGAEQAAERVQLFWSSLAINTLLGVAGGACLWAVSQALLDSAIGAKLSGGVRAELVIALPWLAAAVPAGTLAAVCTGALEARERFLAVNALQVGGGALFQLLPLAAAVWAGPRLDVLIAAAMLARFSTLIASFLVCRRALPLAGRPRPNWRLVRPLLRYGGWVTVSSVISPVLDALDRFLIAALRGPVAVTFYTVPYNLVAKFRIFPISLTRALFPRFSRLDNAQGGDLARQAVLALATVTAPLVALGIALMHPFLSLWLGAEFAQASSPVGQVLLLGAWLNGLAFIPYSLLQGQGRPRAVALLHLSELLPFVALLWFAVQTAGIEGAAWAWALRVSVDAALLFRLAGFRARELLPLVTALCLLGSMLAGVRWLDGSGQAAWVVGVLSAVAVWAWRVAPESLRRLVGRGSTLFLSGVNSARR